MSLIPLLANRRGRRSPDGASIRRATLTLSGNEMQNFQGISRKTATEGDGGNHLGQEGTGVWEATTTLITNGGFETNTTGWTNQTANASISQSTEQAKFGNASLKVVTDGVGTSEGAAQNTSAGAAVVAASVYVFSAWVYSAAGGEKVRININWYTGVPGYISTSTGTEVTLVAGWQRIEATALTAPGTAEAALVIVLTSTVQAITFYIDGVQGELQPIATPYVETDGGTAARTAGRVRATITDLNITPTQFWVACQVKTGWDFDGDPTTVRLWGWGDATDDRIDFNWNGTANWQLSNNATGGAGDQAINNGDALSFLSGDSQTLIGALEASEMKCSAGGAAFNAAGSRSEVPTISASTMDIGSSTGYLAGREADADFSGVLWGKGTLTDGDALFLKDHLGPTNGLQYFLDHLPLVARPTAYWDGLDEFIEVLV